MDIDLCKPNKSSNWQVMGGILYYKNYFLIPIANFIDGQLYVNLDKRCMNAVIKILTHLEEKNIDYLFSNKEQIYEKEIYVENLPHILRNNLLCLDNEKFFEAVQQSKFDYLGKIVKFIELFDCYKDFMIELDYINKNHFDKFYYNPYGNNHNYVVENEDIRSYINSLEREISIMLLLS